MTKRDFVYRVFCGDKLFECVLCERHSRNILILSSALASFDDLQLECFDPLMPLTCVKSWVWLE